MGAIEDAHDAMQIDFANAYIGGGVLSGGCVQVRASVRSSTSERRVGEQGREESRGERMHVCTCVCSFVLEERGLIHG